GFRWTPIDFDRYVRHGGNPIYTGFGRSPLQSFYFGVGVRLMVPDLKRVIPYVSGAFDLNFWNFREVAPVCGLWFCTVANIYYFSPGFTGRLGLAIKIVERFYIDVNVGLGMTFKGQFWNHNENWIEPMVAFMFRR